MTYIQIICREDNESILFTIIGIASGSDADMVENFLKAHKHKDGAYMIIEDIDAPLVD